MPAFADLDESNVALNRPQEGFEATRANGMENSFDRRHSGVWSTSSNEDVAGESYEMRRGSNRGYSRAAQNLDVESNAPYAGYETAYHPPVPGMDQVGRSVD